MKNMQSQLFLEAKISILLTTLYLILWAIFGYGLDMQRGFLSLPLWFEFSCIYLPITFIIILIICIKKYFKNINLTN